MTAVTDHVGRLSPAYAARVPTAESARGLHERLVPVCTRPMPIRYKPRHCAGVGCLHDHPGDRRPRLGRFARFALVGLFLPGGAS